MIFYNINTLLIFIITLDCPGLVVNIGFVLHHWDNILFMKVRYKEWYTDMQEWVLLIKIINANLNMYKWKCWQNFGNNNPEIFQSYIISNDIINLNIFILYMMNIITEII